MSWKIALAKLATTAGLNALNQHIDSLLEAMKDYDIRRPVEFRNETDLTLSFNGDDSSLTYGYWEDGPDNIPPQEMEVFGVRSGSWWHDFGVVGIAVWDAGIPTSPAKIATRFAMPPTREVLQPNQIGGAIGEVSQVSRFSHTFQVDNAGYRLVGTVADRAWEYTLSKLS